jgi:hypothetical protein
MLNTDLTNCIAIINLVILGFTAWYIKKYTNATLEMLKQTKRTADTQSEQLGLQQRPTVIVSCADLLEQNFRTLVKNNSEVHAKIRIRATVKAGSETIDMPAGNPYDGVRTWSLHAKSTFSGNIGLQNIIVGQKWAEWSEKDLKVQLTFRVWAINFRVPDGQVLWDDYEEPLAQWFWDWKRSLWVMEMPAGIVESGT